jgi:hypothetical protein
LVTTAPAPALMALSSDGPVSPSIPEASIKGELIFKVHNCVDILAILPRLKA